MSTLYFCNKGEFDIRAMLTFGVSVKEGANPIGFFGTGFKYAVAIVLRLGGRIKVFSGTKMHTFEAVSTTIRGQEFNIVMVHTSEEGKDTISTGAGFTTHVGANWLPWMAFRELWCNCKDEEGEVVEHILNVGDCSGVIVQVDCKELFTAWTMKGCYILSNNNDALEANEYFEVYDRPSTHVFYRGIAVLALEHPSMLTYNVKQPLQLTEDRTCAQPYMANHYIKRGIQQLTDEATLRRILVASSDNLEARISYDADYTVSDQFLTAARRILKTGGALNESARTLLKIKDHKDGDWPVAVLTSLQQEQLRRAQLFLKALHLPVDEYTIIVVTSLGDGIMGRALHGTIYVALLAFNMGTKQVASTLMEEYVHLKTGADDLSREMQNWLFDKILSIGEEFSGDPL